MSVLDDKKNTLFEKINAYAPVKLIKEVVWTNSLYNQLISKLVMLK